jgi:hypothetical protein
MTQEEKETDERRGCIHTHTAMLCFLVEKKRRREF